MAKEQVVHAVKINVLILRTIDLLNLLYLYEEGKISTEEVIKIFTKDNGWLKVSQEEFSIIKE